MTLIRKRWLSLAILIMILALMGPPISRNGPATASPTWDFSKRDSRQPSSPWQSARCGCLSASEPWAWVLDNTQGANHARRIL